MINRLLSNKKKHIFCIILAFLFTVIAVYLNIGKEQEERVPSLVYTDVHIRGKLVSLLDNLERTPDKCKIDNNTVTPTEESGASVLFSTKDNAKEEIHTVTLQLTKSLWHATEWRLYYPDQDGNFSKEGYDKRVLPKGNTKIIFKVPRKVDYPIDRFKISCDDNYEISDICISAEAPYWIHKVKKNYWAVPVYFFILICILELLCIAGARYIGTSGRACRYYFTNVINVVARMSGSALLSVLIVYVITHTVARSIPTYWRVAYSGFGALAIWQIGLLFRKICESGEVDTDTALKTSVGRQSLFWLLIVLFSTMIVYYLAEGEASSEKLPRLLDRRSPVFLLLIEIFILAFLYKKYAAPETEKGRDFTNIYIFTLFVLSFIYTWLFLPYVVPDEPVHYVSSYRLSNLFLGKFSQYGDCALLMRMEDFAFYKHRYQILSSSYYSNVIDAFKVMATRAGTYAIDESMSTNAILSYTFSALGIAMARILHLSGVMTFYIGRLANVLAYLAILRVCMKKIPSRCTALYTVAAMPMMLHVANSYSYDALIFGFVTLFVTQVMMLAWRKEKIKRNDYIRLIIYAALLGPSKLIYLPLLFLVFLIPSSRFGGSGKAVLKKKITVVISGFLAVVVVFSGIGLMTSMQSAGTPTVANSDHILDWINEEGYTLSWIMGHIWDYILMNVRTFLKFLDTYVYTMAGAKMGWWNLEVPYVFGMTAIVLFLFAVNVNDTGGNAIFSVSERNLSRPLTMEKRFFILLLCICSWLAVHVVMAVSFTPVTDNFIRGVQGRYFLPLLVPVAWILQTDLVKIKSRMRSYILLFSTMLDIWLVVYLYYRYVLGGKL